MNENAENDCANDEDRFEDAVDPRVQIELERLNTATDDINKLEVDLDEARRTFRELLCESSVKIDRLAKNLGACIEKSRPYYDARFKAKEALRDAQKAAIRFERANGQHAAAKEMVYLAEEGLKTEGRCFDHAWQEMLNHATSRVNESEHERALSEAEHRHTTAVYHKAEHNVQKLQRELKRVIAKSSMGARRSLLLINSIAYRHTLLMLPYYEMKALFNQMLEEQKTRVSVLERSVGEAKMTYAEALRNLERISDEIHRTRRYDGTEDYSKHQKGEKGGKTESKNSGDRATTADARNSSDSSITGSPDSTDYASDEYLRLPEKMSPNTSCPVPQRMEKESTTSASSSEYLGLSNLNLSSIEPRKYIKRERPRSMAAPSDTSKLVISKEVRTTSLLDLAKTAAAVSPVDNRESKINVNKKEVKVSEKYLPSSKEAAKATTTTATNGSGGGEEWTEISLNDSPDEVLLFNDDNYSDEEEENQIPYKPLPSELSPEMGNERATIVGIRSGKVAATATNVDETSREPRRKKQLINQKSLPVMLEKNEPPTSFGEENKPSEVSASPSSKGRAKLDGSLANWISRSSAAGETSCTSSVNSSRRQSLDMLWSTGTVERAAELLSHGIMMLDIGNLSERFRGDGKQQQNVERVDKNEKNEKTEVVKGKKVPSPLEKTLSYLNPDEETSDSESLASVEMLSEDQISSLMMEQDMNQVCQDILGTPLVEVCPLLQQLQQQQ
ncbi:uncharacterized protein [Venturia canescens]|uniref:uncharacterized protein isoform X2 n=1 Tax=Venturia canescens TaxID=32260 RepID=UPI001C9D0C16|nr:uncharacterized protein LOC122413905 isoform X2 [Venturia canescens]